MTGRTLMIAAAGSTLLAGAALAARPFLPSPSAGTQPVTGTDFTAAPLTARRLADMAATRALRCPPAAPATTSPTPRSCGRWERTRQQASCTGGTCRIDLLGAVVTDGSPRPVALTVMVHRDATGWRVTAVTS